MDTPYLKLCHMMKFCLMAVIPELFSPGILNCPPGSGRFNCPVLDLPGPRLCEFPVLVVTGSSISSGSRSIDWFHIDKSSEK